MEIILDKFHLTIYGFGAKAPDKNYSATAFALSNKMWNVVKAKGLENRGKNIWVYGNSGTVFTGVELIDTPRVDVGLEKMTLTLDKHASFMHTGPYHHLKEAWEKMALELNMLGYHATSPSIEIYGHWSADESKLETELIMGIL